MATCRVCNLCFHACSSCGMADWEWDYCCVEHLNENQKQVLANLSEKYKLSEEELRSLSEELREIYL